MLRSVLLPADLTENSALLVQFAAGLAALGVRRVVLGHSVEASGMEGPVIVAAVDRARERLRESAAVLADAGLDTEVRVVTGPPSSALIALASEAHVDAVVAGSSGKGVLDRFLGGSVSEELLVQAERPTLFVRFALLANAADPAALLKALGRTLVLPTDFSSSSMRALTVALGLPKGFVGTLYLVHVVDPALSEEALRKAEQGAEFQLRNMAAMAAESGITARSVIRRGDPKREILREIDERRASGVITGTRGRSAISEAVMGSVSLTMLRQASCPVLVVP
jgi:nucleotide-binding universal stress UspA family protein